MDIFAKPLAALLKVIFDFVNGIGLDSEIISAYAIALILTTIIFKLILLPLGIKQSKSMKKMQEIQPQLKEIQKKYKNDPQTQQAKTMELYKKHNANPFSSCLPLLIQMPILIGMFRVLRQAFPTINESTGLIVQGYVFPLTSDTLALVNDKLASVVQGVETITPEILANLNNILAQYIPDISSNFFWLTNLKDPDPILWGLPLLAGLTTFLQSKLMSSNRPKSGEDKSQQTQQIMNMVFPVLIFMMSRSFPAGLALYWVVGNIFTIVQQYFTNKAVSNVKEESK